MKAGIVVSTLLMLVVGWAASPVHSAGPDKIHGPSLERLVEHLDHWQLDQQNEVLFERSDGSSEWGRMCGTPPPTEEFLQEIRREMPVVSQALREVNIESVAVSIPLVFHIVQKSDGQGRVSDERIAMQVEAFNREFRRFGAEFYVLEVNDIVKNSWYKKCLPVKKNGKLNGKYFKMTRKNGIDPASTVNIYTCKPWGNIIGFAVPAGFLAEDDPNNAIVLYGGVIAGGPYIRYDKGITGVHEMGHYLGLFHTFHPGTEEDPIGCTGEGDFVDDTPYEAEPAFECVPRDTCPQPGMDPIKNFMDYTDDYCAKKFSRGQRRLMEDMTFWYRPTLFGY